MVRTRISTTYLIQGTPTVIIKSGKFLYIPCSVSFMHRHGNYFLGMFLRWWNIKGGILCEFWNMDMGKTMEGGNKGKSSLKYSGGSSLGSH